MSDPNLGVVAGAVLAVSAEPPSIQFRVDESLRGDGSGELRMRVNLQDLALLAPGSAYLAVYTDQMPAPLKPRKLMRVADSRRLMTFEGVELSLFRDTPQMRALLAADPVAASHAADYRSRVFAGLASSDPQLSDLWSGELALRAQRLSPFSAAEQAAIESFVRSARSPERARARLLLMAHDRQPIFGSDWFVQAAAAVLDATPVRSEPDIPSHNLIYAALTIAMAHPQSVSDATLEAWLAASPVLAESAALALRKRSPDSERGALERVLARALLSPVTRQFLQQHHQRLPARPTSAEPAAGERSSP
ncbi:MAG TPA: hypothetical protein VN259_10040 [Xanthomonadales bacterium]|nr:hypothetical protein [Xanthomonadales bacterium]